jgi:PAS domain S-box-containing protein
MTKNMNTLLRRETLNAFQNPVAIKSFSGEIIDCNQAFLDLYQSSHEEIIGRESPAPPNSHEAEMDFRFDQLLLTTPERHCEYQVCKTTVDGQQFTVNIHKALLSDAFGGGILVVLNTQAIVHKPKISYSLTTREIGILELLIKGGTHKQIATTLRISPHTVADHLKSIYIKLSVNTRTQAQYKAIRELGLG